MENKFLRIKNTAFLWTIIFISFAAAVCILSSCGRNDTKSETDSEIPTTSDFTTTTVSSSLITTTTTQIATSSAISADSTNSALTTIQITSLQISTTVNTTKPPVKPPVQTTSKKPVVTTVPPAPKPPVITAQPPAVIPTGSSPNSAFYQQNIVIAGDSIATGFSLFGFVPSNHSLSLGSLSMSNIDWYYPQNKGVSFVDGVMAVQPKLLYMSMGMNDVNMTTPEKYAEKYISVINQILSKTPNATIVAAGITPVTDGIRYTNNARIRSFNTALSNAVKGMNSDRVYYFDAYSVLADPATLGLRQGYSSGDGIHLANNCYSQLLSALYNMLDTTNALQNMQS
ncbi:MAG TPA: GDSL-type esterase/lipase family protein [Ruminococcus sp.]